MRFVHRRNVLAVGVAACTMLWSHGDVSARVQVPAYDPERPIDLGRYSGEERPRQDAVMNAFTQQFDALIGCVEGEKARTKKPDTRLLGDATITILLNPDGAHPLGVNAELPRQHRKRVRMRECLRVATWKGQYPRYDGPPVVVEFSFELDAGYDWVEE